MTPASCQVSCEETNVTTHSSLASAVSVALAALAAAARRASGEWKKTWDDGRQPVDRDKTAWRWLGVPLRAIVVVTEDARRCGG